MTPFELEARSGLVPLFPLPDNCLLPGELQAFHIFEPRYRKLLADALEGEGLIGMPRFLSNWSRGEFAHPAVRPVFGVGRIVSHEALQGGTSDIVLQGIARVRLVDVLRESPYRLARVAELPEHLSDPERLRQIVQELFDLVARASSDLSSICYRSASDQVPALELPGRLARYIRFDKGVKQGLLETDDLVERLVLLRDCLRSGECSVFRREPNLAIRTQKPFPN